MSRRTELRATRPEDRNDRRCAERLWAAAARGDRIAFDRIFDSWLARSYEAAWELCHDRDAAQSRARAQMLEAMRDTTAAQTKPLR
jgi:hypothetical protein